MISFGVIVYDSDVNTAVTCAEGYKCPILDPAFQEYIAKTYNVVISPTLSNMMANCHPTSTCK